DPQLHYVLKLEGRLDEARVRRAVRLAMDAEPVFGCRYVPRNKPFWERRDDLDSIPLCEVLETTEVQRELERFAARPSDATRDPLVEIRIVRGASDSLCLKVSHVPADGAGGKELLYLIATLYRALEKNPSYRVAPNLGVRGAGQLFRRFGWRRSLAAIAYPALTPPENIWRFPVGDLHDIGTRTFAARRLDPVQSKALRDYAIDAGATLNDVLLAALFRGLWRFLDFSCKVPQPAWIPVDFRGYLPSGKTEAICNFVGMMYPTLCRIPGEPFQGTLQRLQQNSLSTEHRERFALFYSLLIALTHHCFLERIGMRMERVARKNLETRSTAVHFSNNRTLSLSKLDFGLPIVDADQFVPAAIPPGLLISVLSFRGSIKFAITYFDRAMKTEDVERFFDTFLEELSSVTQQPLLAGAAQTDF
ncbi:MAG TPA: hypothetical protein VH640_19375, partial [Bryobacteraceae bacterium]